MSFLLSLYTSLLRIILLLLGVMIAFSIGLAGYNSIAVFLTTHNYPCLEVVSLLIIFVPPIALFYGQHIRKFFWQRINKYDLIIAIVSFLIGVLLALFPIIAPVLPSTLSNCVPASTLTERATFIVGTGIVSTLLAFIGVDIGVVLKHLSLHLTRHMTKHHTKKAKRSKKK